MATDVTMPRLSDSMEEGTVLKWLVEQGGEVKRGEALVEIETDKANMTYEADTDGTLIEVIAGEGDTLSIGEVIARVGDPSEASEGGGGDAGDAGGEADAGESGDADAEAEAGGDQEEEEEEEAATAESEEERSVATAEEDEADEEASKNGGAPEGGGAPAGSSDGNGRVKASPVARRIAGEQGVDLSSLDGSGPGGRIVKADVLAAADGAGGGEGADEATETGAVDESGAEQEKGSLPEPQGAVAKGEAGPKGEVHVQELTRLQQTVSRRMAESKATAPDFTLEVEVDMAACVELRGRLKEVADPVPSFNDMIVKACALSLREHPRVNGAYKDGQFELYEKINIGVAVAAKDTLVVPTLFNVGSKSLGEIARAAHAAIDKVRDGTITPPELSGGTFTVSNLGMFGIDRFSAVINPPQAAILTVGALRKKPFVEESGRVVARDMATLSLVSDHRILYGADGAQFLARVREALEQPLSLAL